MKLQDLLENKKKPLKALVEDFSKDDDEKEVDEVEDTDTSEDALEKDPSELKEDESDESEPSDKDESEDDSSDDASDESSDDEDDSFVFTLSVEDVLDQETIFVKMGKDAAKDDDDADAAIDEAEAVEQILKAMGDRKEVTGTIDSLKEEGIDLSDVLEYYEKELQEKLDAVEELESELGIQGSEVDEDEEGLHGDLEDTGIMTGLEDTDSDDSEFPVEESPSDDFEGYHLETLDRHGVSPERFTSKLDFGSDSMMDPTTSLHPEARESEYYDEY